MKQTPPTLCLSPKAVTYDSFKDRASQEEQREISGRDQSEQELMKSQTDCSHHRITSYCSYVFVLCALPDVHLNRLQFIEPLNGLIRAYMSSVLGDCCFCCRRCFFAINIRKKEQTNCSHIYYLSACLSECVCGGGWLRRAASGQHVATLNRNTHTRWWRRQWTPFRYGLAGTHTLQHRHSSSFCWTQC